MILKGIIVGCSSMMVLAAISYLFKMKARKKSSEALFRVFTWSALSRILVLCGIIVWGFNQAPLAGLFAIVSYGFLFLFITFIETRLLWSKHS